MDQKRDASLKKTEDLCLHLVEENDPVKVSYSHEATASFSGSMERKRPWLPRGSESSAAGDLKLSLSGPQVGSTSSDDFVQIETPQMQGLAYTVPDTETTTALVMCKQQVLKPYMRFLKVPGWRPLITIIEPALWKSVVNFVYPIVVVCIIFLGYTVQFAACYSRSNPGYEYKEERDDNGTIHYVVSCYDHSISSYAIPNVLHIGVYAYCFYLFSWVKTEQLQMLMEKTFLQCKSMKQRGYLSQEKLTASLKWFLWIGIFWIALSFVTQTLGVAGRAIEHNRTRFGNIEFTWMGLESVGGQYALAIVMVLAFVALDVVYVAVVVNYMTQCNLLIFLIRCIAERVREKSLSLQQAIKEFHNTGDLISKLNAELGIAVSLLEFLFGWMAVSACLSLKESTESGAVITASAVMTVIQWAVVVFLPFIYAACLSNACGTIGKLGFEIRTRPFVYQDAAQSDLDSFLLFTSSFQPRAKLFRIPIYSPYLWSVAVAVCFIVLLLAQQDIIPSGVF